MRLRRLSFGNNGLAGTTGIGALQVIGDPLAGADDLIQVDTGFDVHAMQHIQYVFSSDIAGRTLGIGQPPRPAADECTMAIPASSAARILASAMP